MVPPITAVLTQINKDAQSPLTRLDTGLRRPCRGDAGSRVDAGLLEGKIMQSPFTWAGVSAVAFAPASMPWFVWTLLAAAALAVAVTGKVLDHRLRRHAMEKVPAQRVVDILNAAPASRRGPRAR
jgi:hypothetical protein